jgi:hypothetical protein
MGQDLVEPFARPQQLAGVNVDVGRLAAQPLDPRLVDQDAGVGERIA